MTTAVRSDPLRNFKFQVQINYLATDVFGGEHNLAELGFMSVSGLQVTTEMIPYREGGMSTTTRKMPGQSDYPPVTFNRGLFAGQSHIWQWFKDVFFFSSSSGDPSKDFRTNITIRVLQHPSHTVQPSTSTGGGVDPVAHNQGQGKAVFRLHNAWPLSWQISDLDAGGNGIIMEQLTVCHEGMVYNPAQSKNPNSYANE